MESHFRFIILCHHFNNRPVWRSTIGVFGPFEKIIRNPAQLGPCAVDSALVFWSSLCEAHLKSALAMNFLFMGVSRTTGARHNVVTPSAMPPLPSAQLFAMWWTAAFDALLILRVIWSYSSGFKKTLSSRVLERTPDKTSESCKVQYYQRSHYNSHWNLIRS